MTRAGSRGNHFVGPAPPDISIRHSLPLGILPRRPMKPHPRDKNKFVNQAGLNYNLQL